MLLHKLSSTLSASVSLYNFSWVGAGVHLGLAFLSPKVFSVLFLGDEDSINHLLYLKAKKVGQFSNHTHLELSLHQIDSLMFEECQQIQCHRHRFEQWWNSSQISWWKELCRSTSQVTFVNKKLSKALIPSSWSLLEAIEGLLKFVHMLRTCCESLLLFCEHFFIKTSI